ncbi:MAG: glycine zipper 2TM domain-containing protein [Gemmatimonadaceae bacterium]|nr:glycine zipper 2TM domain-containing protein [Gemmatimonadaceae bacterium]
MLKKLIVLPVALVAFACAKGDNKNVDSALNADLTTAAAARAYTPLDSVSAAERAAALNGTAPTTTVTRTAPAPTRTRVVYRDRPVRSSGSSSSGSSGSTVYSSPAPQPTVVKNTKRDATIGAVAGAVIGATTSRNKVKGAVIGGAAGAILGGVIGNNVDKTKKY